MRLRTGSRSFHYSTRQIEHYEFAGRVSSARFASDNSDRYLSVGFIRPRTALVVFISESYPEVQMLERVYPIELVLPHECADASDVLREAGEVLASMGPTEA